MKINVNGKEVEAYALIMRKENALEILNGKKTIETRMDSQKYYKMFMNDDIVERNYQKMKSNSKEPLECAMRSDVEYVHFYSAGAPWHLDVKIDSLSRLYIDNDEDIDILNSYGFHDFDEQHEEFKKNPPVEPSAFFAFHINEIISHSGLN